MYSGELVGIQLALEMAIELQACIVRGLAHVSPFCPHLWVNCGGTYMSLYSRPIRIEDQRWAFANDAFMVYKGCEFIFSYIGEGQCFPRGIDVGSLELETVSRLSTLFLYFGYPASERSLGCNGVSSCLRVG